MVTCAFCYNWCPEQLTDFGYTDTTAKCKCKNRFTTSNETCDNASITGGGNVSQLGHSKADADHDVDTAAKGKRVRDNAGKNAGGGSDRIGDGGPICIDNTCIVEDGEYRLFGYQLEDVERFEHAKAFALLQTAGTGKTPTVLEIAARKFRNGEINAVLYIGPNGVHVQTYRELAKWLKVPYEAQCLYGRGGAREAYAFEDDPEFLQVICVNIDTFSTPSKWKDIVEWANDRKTFIILDEAQLIKNPASKRSQHILYEFNKTIRKGKTILASQVNSEARAVLTGTIVTNGPTDAWSVYEFLSPNYFGRNYYSFKNYYGMYTKQYINDRVIDVPLSLDWWEGIKACMTYEEASSLCGCSVDTYNTVHSQDSYKGPYKHADELKELMLPVSSIRLLTDCVDMPEQFYITRRVEMSEEQRRCYNDMVNNCIAEYAGKTATALNKLSVVIRLQQISSGFISEKMPGDKVTCAHFDKGICCKTAEECCGVDDCDGFEDGQDKILEERDANSVCALWDLEDVDYTPDDEIQWIGTSCPKLDQLYLDIETCEKPVIVVTRFTAEAARIYETLAASYSTCLITGWKRVGTVEEFQDGKYDVMVANIAAIARGFNFQRSCTMLFYSNTHSLELRLQGEGRIFRVGQGKPCRYFDYVNEDSVDEKVVAALQLKRNLLDFINSAESIKELVG